MKANIIIMVYKSAFCVNVFYKIVYLVQMYFCLCLKYQIDQFKVFSLGGGTGLLYE